MIKACTDNIYWALPASKYRWENNTNDHLQTLVY